MGEGAYGTVHEGNLDGTDVAVKRFIEKAPYAWSQVTLREVVALCCIPRHPFVLHMFMAQVDERKRVHIVMPRLKVTLHKHLKNVTPTQANVLQWARQIVQGLAHIHAHGFIHRDLKMENILLDHDDNAVIADLGMCRNIAAYTPLTGKVCSLYTRAPEVYEDNGKYTEKMDAWSLGIVLLALSAGKYIFRTTLETTVIDSAIQALSVSADERIKRLETYGMAMPPKFFHDVARLLDIDPEKRLSVRDLAKDTFWAMNGALDLRLFGGPHVVPVPFEPVQFVPLNAEVSSFCRWIVATILNLKRAESTAKIALAIFMRCETTIVSAAASCSLACKYNEISHISSLTWASASGEKVKTVYDMEENIMVTLRGRLLLPSDVTNTLYDRCQTFHSMLETRGLSWAKDET